MTRSSSGDRALLRPWRIALTSPRRTATACAVLLGVGLAGCSGDGSDSRAERATTTTVSSPSVAAPADDGAPGAEATTPGIISPPLPAAPALGDPIGIRSDATMAGCGTDPGEVVATGSVTNRSDRPTDILVTVSWIAGRSSDVLARAHAPLEDVEAGQVVEWRAVATLGADRDDVSCVLNVRRGTLGG